MTRSGPGLLRGAVAVLRLELLLERRTGEATLSALLFAALVLVVSAFAVSGTGAVPAAAAAAGYWIAVGLSAQLAVVRSWTRDRDDGALDGLRLAPLRPASVLLGKTLALAGILLVVEAALALPTLVLFGPRVPLEAAWILPAALLATLGIAVVGSLFGAMVTAGSSAELLVGVAVYPLLIPLFLGAVEVTRSALLGGGFDEIAGWLAVLAALDLILGGAALATFGPAVEE